METLNPIDVLKEDMESEEIAIRVNAIHRLRILVTILPQDKIKSFLIPFLDQLIKKEEDEVLFALADEIGYIAPLIPNQSLLLLPSLEILAGYDETVVRDSAIKSIIVVCTFLSDAELISQIIPMLFRLANNESNFTCRVSAVNLMCPLYPRAGNQKEKIRQLIIFTELCNEETPMVRRTVAIKIGEIAQFMDKSNVLNDLIPIQKQLCQDEQDQVRLLCMESLKNMAKILQTSENKTNTLPLIIQAAEDKSWRVRLALSKIFAELADAMGKEISDSSLIQIFSNLLKDVESDVRVVAVHSLAKFIKQVSVERLQLIIPLLQQLSRDSQAQVKVAVTEVFGAIASLLSKEHCQQKLSAHLLEMLNDENFEVRKGAAIAVGKFAEVLGADGLQIFGPALKNRMEDPKWRVRKEALITVASLGVKLKSPEMFTKYLEPVFMCYLKDRSWDVRQTGNLKLPELASFLKNDWIPQSLVPKIAECLGKDMGATFRINAIYAIQSISTVTTPEVLADKLFPMVIKNLKDPIPNVRFVALKVLKSFTKRIDIPQIQGQIKQAILEMQEDTDRDVKFYASEQ